MPGPIAAGSAIVLSKRVLGNGRIEGIRDLLAGYFTVNPELDEREVDWEWLDAQRHLSAVADVRRIHLVNPVIVTMNDKKGAGVELKPSTDERN